MSDGVFDWTREPYVLELTDMVRILRRSATTIRRQLAAGTFDPLPLPRTGRTSPLQWSRAAVQSALEQTARRAQGAPRNHFGKARQRAA